MPRIHIIVHSILVTNQASHECVCATRRRNKQWCESSIHGVLMTELLVAGTKIGANRLRTQPALKAV